MLIRDDQLSREIAQIRGWKETAMGGAGKVWEKPDGGITPLGNVVTRWQELSAWLASEGLQPGIQHLTDFWAASVKRNEEFFTAYDTEPGRALALATCQAFGITIERSTQLVVTMPDGSRWAVPIEVIATHRAAHYLQATVGGTLEFFLQDTLTFFEQYPDEIRDWSANNMRWEDVRPYATRIADPPPIDYAEGWANGEWEVRVVER